MKSVLPRRPRRPIDTLDYLAMVERILAGAGLRVAEEEPEDLRRLIALRDVLDDAIIKAVRGLRDTGHTWEEIGHATGTTRQAAIMKWGPKL